MLKGQWGSAKRLALVAATAAAALGAAHVARVTLDGIGPLKTWSQDAVVAQASPTVQSLDDLVQDDDDTELTAQRANPVVAFGFSDSPQQAQALAVTESMPSSPSVSPSTPAPAGASPSAEAGASAPTLAGTSNPSVIDPIAAPTAGEDPMVAAAASEWRRAYEQGFFKSERRPHIMTSMAVPGQTGEAGNPGVSDGGIAAAVGGVVKAGWVVHPHLTLIADIRVAPHLMGVAISNNDPVKDIETIILHEGWHAETFQSPDLNRFNGALLSHDAQAELFWKSATWSANRITYKELTARLPDQGKTLHDVGPNLSNMFEEAGADTAAFVIQAHDKSKEEWTSRLLHVEGTRAHAGIYALTYNDPHETQESLAILARIGYDRLHALNADQSRALIDAVAADGTLLATVKQGWAQNVPGLANAASTIAQVDTSAFTPATATIMAHSYNQMKPAAQQWAQTPDAERARIAEHAIQTVRNVWENGGRLDYSSIAPGLFVDLPGHGTAPSYEVDPAKMATAPLDAQAQREVASRRNVEALDEWKDMAQVLNASPAQIDDLGNTEPFRMMTLWTTPADRATLGNDKVWGANIHAFTARLDAMIAARKAAGGGTITAQEIVTVSPSRKPSP